MPALLPVPVNHFRVHEDDECWVGECLNSSAPAVTSYPGLHPGFISQPWRTSNYSNQILGSFFLESVGTEVS